MESPSSDAMLAVVRRVCEEVDTPRSLAVYLCFKYKCHEELIELPMPATATLSTEAFAKDYFITEYLSKYKGLSLSRDKRQVALEKWRLSEVQCLETNRRFRSAAACPLAGHTEPLLLRAQRKIAAVLGTLVVPRVLDGCRWGPGATFDLKRSSATLDQKISKRLSVTASALPYLKAVVESDPHWAEALIGILPEGPYSLLPVCFRVVKGSRFLTVPKNAKTDRCINAEPTGNSFLQQGVRVYMRHRLKRFGIDLDDQSINRNLARMSYDLGLATLDLSAASDTISTDLVFSLFPLEWALFLDSLRSRFCRVDGVWVRLEKFASMGNAFCFELETLIFWALASTVCEEREAGEHWLSVYGDDIILPSWAAPRVISLFGFCGFTINDKKSYLTGYFFESCGGHYHRGVDVTPVYQKEELALPSEIIRAHNRIVRLSKRSAFRFNPDSACRGLKEFFPLRPFPRIPEGCDEDGGFLRPAGEFRLDPNHGYHCHVLDFVSPHRRANEQALYSYKLRNPDYSNIRKDGLAARAAVGTWRLKRRWISEASALLRINT